MSLATVIGKISKYPISKYINKQSRKNTCEWRMYRKMSVIKLANITQIDKYSSDQYNVKRWSCFGENFIIYL